MLPESIAEELKLHLQGDRSALIPQTTQKKSRHSRKLSGFQLPASSNVKHQPKTQYV